METLYDVVIVLHVASWMVALLGYLATWPEPRVNGWLAHGLTAALVFGVVLVGIADSSDTVADPNHAKIGVKLVVALAAVGIAHATRRRPAPNPMAHVAAALIPVDIVIAYAWV